MKILVTGGSGMVGRFVVDHLTHKFDVEVLDCKKLHRKDIPFHHIDILDSSDVKRVVKGFDAVVHLAGIPHPLESPPEQVFRINTIGTFNVLEACALNEISKFVFMSSESTLGFAFSAARMWPEYVPIDEDHPLRPQDPYGLSKLVCEELCAGFSRRTGMFALALRAPWIWVPEEAELVRYRQLVRDYPACSKNLWAFIHVGDVARAIEAAIGYKGESRSEAFFVCAKENWTGEQSRDLLRRFYPETHHVADDWTDRASFISGKKALSVLGFSPQFGADDLLRI
ncbi:MAG: NAD(P)-dependent oxidoreductase [Ignavibacteriales bacterium]|nr:NAD(P)-dependent oxidoreductase [Ignavibacteriales bacterium]